MAAMDNNHNNHQNLGAAGVPFADTCRAAAIGSITEYAECQSLSPNGCPYRFPFGYVHFCRHPQQKEIVAWTNGTARPAT